MVMKINHQVFAKDVDRDGVLLLGARASRVENQDAIDACIVRKLGDPKKVSNFMDINLLNFALHC